MESTGIIHEGCKTHPKKKKKCKMLKAVVGADSETVIAFETYSIPWKWKEQWISTLERAMYFNLYQ